MNKMAQMNADSWKLAISAMINNRGKVEPYSTSHIRKIMGASMSPDYLKDMKKIIDDYKPAPPQGSRQNQARNETQRKSKVNRDFADTLFGSITGYEHKCVQRLFKYTMRNIKIIEKSEKSIDRLSLILDCEKVDKKSILDRLIILFQSNERNNTNEHNRGGNTQPHTNSRRSW